MIGANQYQDKEVVLSEDSSQIPIGIGANCVVENVIIDKDARIGNNVVIKGGTHLEDRNEDSFAVKEGIVVIKRDAEISDGFVLQ